MVLAWTKAKFSRIRFTLRKCWDHRSNIPLLNVQQWSGLWVGWLWHENHSCPQRGQESRGCWKIGKGESWQLKPWGSLGGEVCACPVSGPWVLAGEGGWNLLLQMWCLLSHHIHGERLFIQHCGKRRTLVFMSVDLQTWRTKAISFQPEDTISDIEVKVCVWKHTVYMFTYSLQNRWDLYHFNY